MFARMGGSSREETMALTREDEAEIVARRFKLERGSDGVVERVFVESDNGRHWSLVWAGGQPGRRRDLPLIDVARLLWIDIEKRPPSRTIAGVIDQRQEDRGQGGR
jgi:hypothetical protein